METAFLYVLVGIVFVAVLVIGLTKKGAGSK